MPMLLITRLAHTAGLIEVYAGGEGDEIGLFGGALATLRFHDASGSSRAVNVSLDQYQLRALVNVLADVHESASEDDGDDHEETPPKLMEAFLSARRAAAIASTFPQAPEDSAPAKSGG